MTDIIVIGYPANVNIINGASPTVAPPTPTAQQITITWSQLPNVESEPDVPQEIVVIGSKLKLTITTVAKYIVPLRNTSWSLPCIGSVDVKELASLLHNMRVKITTQNFGPGRAGENNIGPSGNIMPVSFNDQALKGYDLLTNGLYYLVAHELAHGLGSMQQYNQQLFTQYTQTGGAGMTYDQQKANYPSSPQFECIV